MTSSIQKVEVAVIMKQSIIPESFFKEVATATNYLELEDYALQFSTTFSRFSKFKKDENLDFVYYSNENYHVEKDELVKGLSSIVEHLDRDHGRDSYMIRLRMIDVHRYDNRLLMGEKLDEFLEGKEIDEFLNGVGN